MPKSRCGKEQAIGVALAVRGAALIRRLIARGGGGVASETALPNYFLITYSHRNNSRTIRHCIRAIVDSTPVFMVARCPNAPAKPLSATSARYGLYTLSCKPRSSQL